MNTPLSGSDPADMPAQSLDVRQYPASARMILAALRQLRLGHLEVRAPDGREMHFGHAGQQHASIHIQSWNMCHAVLKSGDIGFAESFIRGEWRSEDLPGLLRLLIRNRDTIEKLIYGTWWGSLFHRIRHLLRRNSRKGSQRNIHAHYDIGNPFYQLWLDRSMTYSSALFEAADLSESQHCLAAADKVLGLPSALDLLALAQSRKYRRILQEIRVVPGMRILEIGCGWGGFAETVLRETGASVTGLTLSTEQLDFAARRLDCRQEGSTTRDVTGRIDLRLQDYREVGGEFDAIASIEMFEAVGEAYWPVYFETVAKRLRKGGMACIQTIVIADELFERYRTGTDFIQQYIFPGGMLPSPTAFRKAAESAGLTVTNQIAFGLSYAHTLEIWRAAYWQQHEAVLEQGFDERFMRTWDFYLAYCQAGFEAGSIDLYQFTLQKRG